MNCLLLEMLWFPFIVTTTVVQGYEVNVVMVNVAGVAPCYARQ
jgi:hypothetical protein